MTRALRRTTGLLFTLLGLAFAAVAVAAAAEERAKTAVGGALPAYPPGHDLVFVVGGDNRPTALGAPLPRVLGTILDEVSLIRPDVVLWSGDTIYGYCEGRQGMEREYRRFLALVEKVGAPLVNAPGNHEIRGNQTCAVTPDCDGACAEALFAGHFGVLYGSFDIGDVHFVALDTEVVHEENTIGAKQLAWLREDLERNKDKRAIFVFSHSEFFSSPQIDAGAAHGHEAIKNRDELHQLFRGYPVKAVFSGHEHLFWREKPEDHDGIAYFVAGGAGAPLYAPPDCGGFSHYLVVRMVGHQILYDVIEPGRLYMEPMEKAAGPGPKTAEARYWIVNGNDAMIPVRGMVVDVPRSFGRCDRLTAATDLKRPNGVVVPVAISIESAVVRGNSCRLTLALPAVPADTSVPVVVRGGK